jgi:hypothetical protein
LAKQLLPVAYYHVVFTLPAEVSDLALANPKALYEALFTAAAATLREVAANPKRLGARLGVLAVLHTWGQNLHHHPHLHCVCTGGGLACIERGDITRPPRWVSCRPDFFLPVRVLGRLFRGKYLALLRDLAAHGQLRFPGKLTALADPKTFAAWLAPLFAKDWVVYAKRPFGGPAQVLKYLARYTHRVAICNHRLEQVADGRVTFRYKDYAAGNQHKTMTLSAVEFLRRFVQHVLPKGFVKLRHYGLLANRGRGARLRECQRLLLAGPLAQAVGVGDAEGEMRDGVAPAGTPTCPKCGGQQWVFRELPEGVGTLGPHDTS